MTRNGLTTMRVTSKKGTRSKNPFSPSFFILKCITTSWLIIRIEKTEATTIGKYQTTASPIERTQNNAWLIANNPKSIL